MAVIKPLCFYLLCSKITSAGFGSGFKASLTEIFQSCFASLYLPAEHIQIYFYKFFFVNLQDLINNLQDNIRLIPDNKQK